MHGPLGIRQILFHPRHKGLNLVASPEMGVKNEIITEYPLPRQRIILSAVQRIAEPVYTVV
jgi:hypothetical protein